jgi:hypothetical protein
MNHLDIRWPWLPFSAARRVSGFGPRRARELRL